MMLATPWRNGARAAQGQVDTASRGGGDTLPPSLPAASDSPHFRPGVSPGRSCPQGTPDHVWGICGCHTGGIQAASRWVQGGAAQPAAPRTAPRRQTENGHQLWVLSWGQRAHGIVGRGGGDAVVQSVHNPQLEQDQDAGLLPKTEAGGPAAPSRPQSD